MARNATDTRVDLRGSMRMQLSRNAGIELAEPTIGADGYGRARAAPPIDRWAIRKILKARAPERDLEWLTACPSVSSMRRSTAHDQA